MKCEHCNQEIKQTTEGHGVNDRGYVVDFYVDNGYQTVNAGQIDREDDPIFGIDSEFTLGWDGDKDAMKIAIEAGYAADVATAIFCNILIGKDTVKDARQQAIDFVNAFLEARE